MGKGSGIDDDKGSAIGLGLMDALHQFVFPVTLQMIKFMAGCFRQFLQTIDNVSQGLVSIMLGFTGAKQVQIGTIEYENAGQ